MPDDVRHAPVRRARSAWAGVLAGIGVAAFVDEVVFAVADRQAGASSCTTAVTSSSWRSR